MDYETVAAGLEIGSLIYLDVRNHDEIKTDGKIVGSFAIPCNLIITIKYKTILLNFYYNLNYSAWD